MNFAFALVALLAIAAGLLALAVSPAWGPVSRARVERFAHRQQLQITPANGERVIRYLAHTRRWRVGGILGGLALGASDLTAGHLGFTTMFVGWFVGAVAAEAGLAAGRLSPRRVASLAPRTYRRYVGRLAWCLLPVATLASVVVAALTASAGHAARQVALALAAIGITVVVMVTRSRIVARAQPHSQPELLAADDAIRSRALHVLSGGGFALVMIGIGEQFRLYGLAIRLDPSWHGLSPLITLAGVILGWSMGTARFRVRPVASLTLAA